MKTAIILIACAIVLTALLAYFTSSRDTSRFNTWADKCREAGGGVTVKSIRFGATTYECVGIDDKAVGLPEMEY